MLGCRQYVKVGALSEYFNCHINVVLLYVYKPHKLIDNCSLVVVNVPVKHGLQALHGTFQITITESFCNAFEFLVDVVLHLRCTASSLKGGSLFC